MAGMMDEVMSQGEEAPRQGEGEEFPAELQPLLDQAIELVYGENFEPLVKMFQGGQETFPSSMATAVNAVLQRLEQETGEPLDQMTAAQVGMKLFQMLLEDLIEGGLVQDVSKEMVISAMQKTLAMWLNQHQDQVDPNETGQSLMGLASALKEGGLLGEQGAPQQDPQTTGQEMMQ